MRICACCAMPVVLTYSHGRRDYCKACYDKKQTSIDIQWAFWVSAIIFFFGLMVGRASAEVPDCPKPDDRDLVIGTRVECLWDFERSGLEAQYHPYHRNQLLDECEKDPSAIKRFLGECK